MGSAVVPATITLRRGRRGRKGSKAEETTESGNAQFILTIFMKFEHLYNTVKKISPWTRKVRNKYCGFVSEARASYKKLV